MSLPDYPVGAFIHLRGRGEHDPDYDDQAFSDFDADLDLTNKFSLDDFGLEDNEDESANGEE